jgi:uncharacterized protein YcfL
MKYHWLLFSIMGLGMILLVGCSSATEQASDAVLNYYNALVNTTENTSVSSLVCADFEAQAQVDADSFGLVEAELRNARCEVTNETDVRADVRCEGTINVTYDGESNTLMDFSDYVFVVEKEDNQWLMCGYE